MPNCCLQLIKSGERDRLKQLLREKLTECGWRDEIKQRCRGAQQLGHRAVVAACRIVRRCDECSCAVCGTNMLR